MGYRARSAFKLVQLDEQFGLFAGMRVRTLVAGMFTVEWGI